MVHILLLILKIIGCLLLLILFLLLLLMMIVLLVPVRYRFAGEKLEGKPPEGQVEVRWLFKLISFTGSCGNRGLRYQLRAAWISLMDSDEEDDGKGSDQDLDFPDDFLEEETEASDKESAEEVPAPTEEPEKIKPAEESTEEVPAPTEEPEEIKPAEEPIEEAPAERPPAAETAGKVRKEEKIPREPLLDRLSGKLDQIQEWLEVRMDALDQKKKQADELLETFPPEIYYPIAMDTLYKVIRHIFPRSIDGWLHFGFEDAYTTGRVCSWTACFYPIYAGSLELTPDFSQKILEGQLQGKGRIRLGFFVRIFIGLLLKKEVRFVICYLLKLRKRQRQSLKRPKTA